MKQGKLGNKLKKLKLLKISIRNSSSIKLQSVHEKKKNLISDLFSKTENCIEMPKSVKENFGAKIEKKSIKSAKSDTGKVLQSLGKNFHEFFSAAKAAQELQMSTSVYNL